MRMNEIHYDSAPPIDGYGPGFFRVEGEVRTGPQVVLPAGATDWAGFSGLDTILSAADQIDVLLIGMGPDVAHPPAEAREAIEAAGIGVEAMSTPSACRTYNVLLSQGRRVGVALLPV